MRDSVLKKALGLEGAVVESACVEGDAVVVVARSRKAVPHCPVCDRHRGTPGVVELSAPCGLDSAACLLGIRRASMAATLLP